MTILVIDRPARPSKQGSGSSSRTVEPRGAQHGCVQREPAKRVLEERRFAEVSEGSP